MSFSEPEAKKGKSKADAERRGGELLGEQHQAERPEKIQRPGDRTGDENRGQEALRDARGV